LVISGALATLALVHSQRQQLSNLVGDTGAVAIQDSTSGHGYNGGAIKVYTGSAPADGNAAETGTILVTVVLPNPLFGAPAGFPQVATANAITAVTIANTGTAGYARATRVGDTGASSTTEGRLQFAVATSGSDMNFNTLALVSGGTLTVTSMTYTAAA
jgi:hypothetical protein